MTTTRDNLIAQITEGLGSAATTADGEMVFDHLRACDLITWNDRRGYVIVEGVDLIAAYEQANEAK
jgi:hypothetical protein